MAVRNGASTSTICLQNTIKVNNEKKKYETVIKLQPYWGIYTWNSTLVFSKLVGFIFAKELEYRPPQR